MATPFLPSFLIKNKVLKNNVLKNKNKVLRVKKRAGVSPVIATTIILAITVSMGLGLYSYAGSQTNVATKSFSDEATDYINYKNDRFTITGLSFGTSGDSQRFTAYIFNNGDRTLRIGSATVSDGTSSTSAFCTDDGMITSKDLRGIEFVACDTTNPFPGFEPSTTAVYHVKIITVNGSFQTYFQKYGQGAG
jgi:hypothetical protein